jgi:precorrin-2 dehydrogenase/sirohydrochlorin ferrochelatase
MFPVFLDLTGRLVVVVGGGAVGLRKARAALAAGAVVRVVDPEADAGPEFAHIPEPYRCEHLDGASLVFAAAPPAVNARVVADAKARGVWVNAATEPEQGDFSLPSVVRRGDFVLAVGTSGAAPALARRVREKLEAEFDAAFAEWVRLLNELRPEAFAITDPDVRRELLDSLAEWHWLDRLRAEGPDAVRTAMRKVIKASRGA